MRQFNKITIRKQPGTKLKTNFLSDSTNSLFREKKSTKCSSTPQTYLFIYLAVLGSEIRASHSTNWAIMPPRPFLLFFFFSYKPSYFLPWPVSEHNPPTSASLVARITDMYHHAQLVLWDRVSLSFCPGWPQTSILLSTLPK
jgi:hypothetical protein